MEENIQLQWVFIYMRTLEKLFLFRYASRSYNWLLHLKECADVIKDITSMDRISANSTGIHSSGKGCSKCMAAHEGNFSIQKSEILLAEV